MAGFKQVMSEEEYNKLIADAEKNAPPGVVEDVAKSGGSGLVRGLPALVGAPGAMIDAATQAWLWGQEKIGGKEHRDRMEALTKQGSQVLPRPEDAINFTAENLPFLEPALKYEPKTTAGHIAQAAGEGVVQAAIPAAAVAGRAAQGGRAVAAGKELLHQGLAPAVASEGAGQVADVVAPDYAPAVRFATGVGTAAGGAAIRDPSMLPGRTEIPGVGDVGRTAAREVLKGVEDVGGFGRAAQEMQTVGEGAALADVGPGLRGQTEALNTTPGPQKQTIRDWLTARQQRMSGTDSQLNQALDTHLEPRDPNFADTQERMTQARRDQAADLYGQAERAAQGRQINADRAQAYTESLIPRGINDLEALTPAERRIVQLQRQIAGRNDYQTLHGLQSTLGREIEQLARSNPDAIDISALRTTRRFINEALDDATRRPDGTSLTAEARRAYRTDSDILDAADYGQGIFDRKERPDEFSRRWRDMGDDERTAARMGARDSLDSKLGPATDSQQFNTGMNALRSDWGRAKLTIMLGPERAQALVDRLEGLARQRGTTSDVGGNSATAQRLAGQKQIVNPEDPMVAKPPLNTQPTLSQIGLGMAKRAYTALARPFAEGSIRGTNQDMARILTHEPQNQAEFLAALEDIYRRSNTRRLPYGFEAGYQAVQGESRDDRPLQLRVKPRENR